MKPKTEEYSSIIQGMVRVSEGTFIMGGPKYKVGASSIHEQEVFLSEYYIDPYPVTNAEFAEFVETTNYKTRAERMGEAYGFAGNKFIDIKDLSWKSFATTPDRANHPVILVSWDDASAYAKWRSKSLPTEAQWEKAARGGLLNNLYSWGDDEPTKKHCNFAKLPAEITPTTPVDAFPPNAYGLYDMLGNVWELCSDWLDYDYHRLPDALSNPQGPRAGEFKVRRGGSWDVTQSYKLSCAWRGALHIDSNTVNVGFRCIFNP